MSLNCFDRIKTVVETSVGENISPISTRREVGYGARQLRLFKDIDWIVKFHSSFVQISYKETASLFRVEFVDL
jgi:hypothetical protein